VLPSWKLLFALGAFLDISLCWPVLVDGWNESNKQSEEPELKKKNEFLFILRHKEEEFNICSAPSAWAWVGAIFSCMCLVEAIIRAREAREIAFEAAALDNFEKKLAKLYSTTRCSVFRQQPGEYDYEEGHQDLILARNTLRLWTPVMTVLFSWIILIPWLNIGDLECGEDSALATIWMVKSMTQTRSILESMKTVGLSYMWKALLPWKTWLKPKRLIKRIKEILRWIRYIRFAGPLLRLVLKLQDQFSVFTKTWRQAIEARAQKAKRIAKRSMMFDDLQRIESFAKLNNTLASIPSQLQIQALDLKNKLKEKQEQAKKLKLRLDELKKEIGRPSIVIPTSELYDQIIDLRQELTTTVITALMSSNLVSPRTRFSVGWRVIVTFALLSELFRLYYSWYLAGTFDISFTDMISSLLVECDQKMIQRFRFMTRRGKPIRRFIGQLLHLPNVELAECRPTSPSSRLVLQMGKIFESTIDVVCFLDIFVWFFTGELDTDGVVIAKPFFSRCIVPGSKFLSSLFCLSPSSVWFTYFLHCVFTSPRPNSGSSDPTRQASTIDCFFYGCN
jgi:hypothetical protein